MLWINEVTSDPKQRHLITIAGYENASITLEFCSSQHCWFFSLVWEDFAIYGKRLVVSPNLLRQWKEILPFGLAVMTSNNLDPLTQDAFAQGIASLYVLTSEDVQEVEAYTYEQ